MAVVTLTSNRTLGDLKARIADELARGDLAAQIALAIDDAIGIAASHRFWFNEVIGQALPLVVGQEYYTGDPYDSIVEIDALYIKVGGQRRNLRPVSNSDLNGYTDGSPTTGEPYCYAQYGASLRFYPVPQVAYPMFFDGTSSLSPLIADTDKNAWTTVGERYVRALAKRELLANVIRDADEAIAQDSLAVRYRDDMLSQTYDRVATGRMACNG